MTTINQLLDDVSALRDEVQRNRFHTDKEAGALLQIFDNTMRDITVSMSALRDALVTSYQGQIEADRIMVEGNRAEDHEVLPFKSKAAE